MKDSVFHIEILMYCKGYMLKRQHIKAMCFQAAPMTVLAALTVCSCISHKGITNLTLLQASEEKKQASLLSTAKPHVSK